MKFWLALTVVMILTSGCLFRKEAKAKPVAAKEKPAVATAADPAKPASHEKKSEADAKLIITPESLLVGKVATFNTAGRFVVLDFPMGKMPTLEQTLFVYRQGLKVGEVKIGDQRLDHMAVADLISGEARKGDEVRDK